MHKEKYQIDPHEVIADSDSYTAATSGSSILERPVKNSSLRVVLFLTCLVFAAFSFKLFDLQIVSGQEYKERSENNRLRHSLILADRGIIYDRNGVELAWNEKPINGNEHSERQYIDRRGFGHILGYAKPPAKDNKGFFYRTYYEGVSGAEAVFDSLLKGDNGTKILETNVLNEVMSENLIKDPVHGKEIHLSIDADINAKLYDVIKNATEVYGFRGGAAVIMDIHTGELIGMTSFPETDSNVLFKGQDREAINKYQNDTRQPYLNRALSGAFTPGSIVKPFVALAALNENLISPNKKLYSSGSLVVRNQYNPDEVFRFNDWRAHGLIDMREAISVSSNHYFYAIGGGYEDQEGLGIDKINSYMRMFGFGEKTNIKLGNESAGVVPSPEWKAQTFKDDGAWYLGNTYHTSIGQYGFLVTPIQAVRATAAIANGGTLLTPRISTEIPLEKEKLDFAPSDLRVIREGMKMSAESGVARSLSFSNFSLAAKTGTAEVGTTKGYINSWVIGFFPYENPKYAFATLLDHVDSSNSYGAAPNMRAFFQWLITEKPEYAFPNRE